MFRLNDTFKLGVATASTQIEGGRVGSNWNDFSDRNKIDDGTNAARANMHYEKVAEDVELLKDLSVQVYRFSVEWARLEPEEGRFNDAAFAHYREELELLRAAGITPLMTLYHFSHPMWFEAKGAFTKKENIDIFLNFVEKCIRELGDLCDDFITINEPNVFAVNAYLFGIWPPEKKSLGTTIKVMNVFIAAHCLAYEAIHRIKKEQGSTTTRVSFAHHMQVFQAKNPHNPIDRFGTRLFKRLFQDDLMRACYKGEFRFPFKNIARVPKKHFVDFIAINYYTRQAVHNFSYAPFKHTPRNDLDWEIYPDGIIESTQTCYDCIPLPIVISENGTCDNTDRFRCRYLFDHLKKIADSPLPFEAYCHWCFIDNFEWKEGESARFGLVHCDYENQKRTIKKSGEFFSEIIQKHRVDREMYARYVEPCNYTIKE